MAGILLSSFLMVFVVFSFVLYIYVLVDILKHEFIGYYKVIWILVIIFFPILGALLYLVFGRSKRIK